MPDRPGMSAGQRGGQVRGREVQPVGGLDDPLPGRWARRRGCRAARGTRCPCSPRPRGRHRRWWCGGSGTCSAGGDDPVCASAGTVRIIRAAGSFASVRPRGRMSQSISSRAGSTRGRPHCGRIAAGRTEWRTGEHSGGPVAGDVHARGLGVAVRADVAGAARAPAAGTRPSMVDALWDEVVASSSMTDLAGRLAGYPARLAAQLGRVLLDGRRDAVPGPRRGLGGRPGQRGDGRPMARASRPGARSAWSGTPGAGRCRNAAGTDPRSCRWWWVPSARPRSGWTRPRTPGSARPRASPSRGGRTELRGDGGASRSSSRAGAGRPGDDRGGGRRAVRRSGTTSPPHRAQLESEPEPLENGADRAECRASVHRRPSRRRLATTPTLWLGWRTPTPS